jgi:hypothetical protein
VNTLSNLSFCSPAHSDRGQASSGGGKREFFRTNRDRGGGVYVWRALRLESEMALK